MQINRRKVIFILLIVLVLTGIALFRAFSSLYGFAAEETSLDNSKGADKDSICAKADNENDSFSDLFEPSVASKHFREDSDSMFSDQNFSGSKSVLMNRLLLLSDSEVLHQLLTEP